MDIQIHILKIDRNSYLNNFFISYPNLYLNMIGFNYVYLNSDQIKYEYRYGRFKIQSIFSLI